MRRFAIAMTVLFVLVMVYVWQHFSAIEIGYHVEAQKQQVQQLQEQNRQLRLERGAAQRPGPASTAWRSSLGMDAPQPGQVVRPESGLDDLMLGAGAGPGPHARSVPLQQ